MAANVNRQDAVFILGMHRSGTSVAARLLNLLGVDLGAVPMVVAEDNQKGFWEHATAVAIDEALLSALGTRWDDPSPLPPDWWRGPRMRPHHEAVQRFVGDEFAAAPLFGIKDPRLCRLLPLWLEALETAPIDPAFVLVLRHPSEVAASIARRDGVARPSAEALWLTHMLDAERHTRPHRRVFVTYDALLAAWRGQARRMAKATGLSWPVPEDRIDAEVEAFMDPALRHFRAGAGVTSPWVAEAYEVMTAAARGEDDEATRRDLDRLQDAFAAGRATFGPMLWGVHGEVARVRHELGEQLARRDDTALELRARLSELTRWAEASAADVAHRDSVIVDLRAKLDEQAGWAQASAAEVARRDDTIRDLHARLDEMTGWARASAAEVVRRDDAIRDLHAKVLELTAWAEAGAGEVARRDEIIADLQAQLSELTRWGRASVDEIARRDEIIEALETYIARFKAYVGERPGHPERGEGAAGDISRRIVRSTMGGAP
jgi:hypothetical protein